jgi:hypothetical protein
MSHRAYFLICDYVIFNHFKTICVPNINSIVNLQLFFQAKHIRHGSSKKCLAITESKKKLVMEDCNSSNLHQQWIFENFDPSKLNESENEIRR